jgi:hypothetical protein
MVGGRGLGAGREGNNPVQVGCGLDRAAVVDTAQLSAAYSPEGPVELAYVRLHRGRSGQWPLGTLECADSGVPSGGAQLNARRNRHMVGGGVAPDLGGALLGEQRSAFDLP